MKVRVGVRAGIGVRVAVRVGGKVRLQAALNYGCEGMAVGLT